MILRVWFAVGVAVAATVLLVSSFNPLGSEEKSEERMKTSLEDVRASEEFTLETPRSFARFGSKDEWLERAAFVRDHILVSCGLWPMPEKQPLNPKVFGRIERDGYSVEKVFFESYPGFFVTGNLYRPLGKKEPFPGVLCPHGHAGRGRLQNDDSGSCPGRCINLARQGYVVFAYDMVGYNDSSQMKHSFADELWGTSLMGLQLWDSIRSVDFIMSLPEVDPTRIACTGESGGGTQTFTLMAVDDRIKAAAPVCMISAHFQGGCECENAPLLRLNTCNVEIASLMAPRPLILVSATGDWTKNNPTVEYPDIRSVYELFGAASEVASVQFDAGHNYNKDSREAVYAWFGKWMLGIPEAEKLKEEPFVVEKDQDLRVFTDERPRPANALTADGLKAYLVTSAKKQLENLKPADAVALEKFQKVMSVAMKHTLSASVPAKDEIVVETLSLTPHKDMTAARLVIGRKGKGEAIPLVVLLPHSASPEKPSTVIVHPDGKNAVVEMGKPLPPLVTSLLEGGSSVVAMDCFQVGELKKGERKRAANHWLTYNRTDCALRVQDILTVIGYVRSRNDVSAVNLVGLKEAGIWCLLANAIAPNVRRTAVDLNGFSDDRAAWEGDNLIPGILRAGGGRIAAALCVPQEILLYNGQGKFPTDFATLAYQAGKRPRSLGIEDGSLSGTEIAQWVLRK